MTGYFETKSAVLAYCPKCHSAQLHVITATGPKCRRCLTAGRAASFTVADRMLAAGQRLRATETMTATTVSLTYAAKWAQGGGR